MQIHNNGHIYFVYVIASYESITTQNTPFLAYDDIMAYDDMASAHGPLLLTWAVFNPGMDKLLYPFLKYGVKLLIHTGTSMFAPLKFENG